ncbi:MAG: hypothetical protein NPIRA04_33420 [Nitrospirales bacterium]|nr:MAG: hypothetical protein NPIRA04_33420 [Nitrospirales bacterium]
MTNCVEKEPKHWMSYLIDSLVNSGALPSWEALDYVTTNLLGDSPNARLHHSKSPYEATQQFLNRVYGPIVEAASRTIDMPTEAMIHMFTDISLIGKSAVLVVYFPGNNQPHQLLLLDSAPAWDLVFESETTFNHWAEERYQWITQALQTIVTDTNQTFDTLKEPALANMS